MFFIAIKQKKNDPLRRSRIIFSIIVALYMIFFLTIPTMISREIGVTFFDDNVTFVDNFLMCHIQLNIDLILWRKLAQ